MKITIREPASAITHYIGMMLSLAAAAPLLVKAQSSKIPSAITAMGIFILAGTVSCRSKRKEQKAKGVSAYENADGIYLPFGTGA